MSSAYVLGGILVMAGVTYLIRMIPLVFCRRKVTNRFLRSFLYYVPYAVLSAMTFPYILNSTASVASAAVGLVVATLLAFWEKNLLVVALGASTAVLVAEVLL